MSFGESWRVDPNMTSKSFYKKKFALFPIKCFDGEKVWLENYYKKYTIWGTGGHWPDNGGDYGHTDFIEDISEAEYIVRRLKEGF
jgi:hypothetical protein